MSTYVVGDIQGCYKGLKRLLAKVDFSPARDRLWCVGDLINRGPRSLETLRFLRDIDSSLSVVLGNHDLHFLAMHEGFAPNRTKDTLSQLLDANDCEELCEWLRQKPLAHFEKIETENGPEDFLMVHAGIAPNWSIKKTLSLAKEVEMALRGGDYRIFLKSMYGDKPSCWHDSLDGQDRLRAITNYITRVRFCDELGNLNLQVKDGLSSTPEGFKPWYEYEKISDVTTILFGHWAALEGRTGKRRVVALDTGYVWGRKLTLMRLEDHKYYSISG